MLALVVLPLALVLSASRLVGSPPRTRAVVAASAADGPNPRPFDDFERECFGDDDGCDAWFYGEDPTEEKRLSVHDSPERDERLLESREAGQRIVDLRRQREADMEAVNRRIRDAARQRPADAGEDELHES